MTRNVWFYTISARYNIYFSVIKSLMCINQSLDPRGGSSLYFDGMFACSAGGDLVLMMCVVKVVYNPDGVKGYTSSSSSCT